jgi:hypothetical protein
MDLRPLAGLKKRALQPVPDAAETVPDDAAVEQAETAPQEPEQQETAAPEDEAVAEPAEAEAEPDVDGPAEAAPADAPAEDGPADGQESAETTSKADQPPRIEPAEEEHSGHVTLYLPRDLNQWLGEYHASSGTSYPEIILDAINWAASTNRLSQIFAPVEKSPIPTTGDIFGRPPVIARPARGSIDAETRPLRFRRDHMKVIISVARTWTAGNRNALFSGVLSAYRDELEVRMGGPEQSGQ